MGSQHAKPVLRKEDIVTLVNTSGLDEDEVKIAFDKFIENHRNGKITPKDLHKMMSKALPTKDSSNMEKNVFRLYDTNNDGFIDFTEFMTTFHILADGKPEEVLAKIFRVFDVNDDGSISRKELENIIKDMHGVLKTEDSKTDIIAKAAFQEMDTNEDGKVTLDEFIQACMAQEEFSKMLTLLVFSFCCISD